jgi:hypothetical protein
MISFQVYLRHCWFIFLQQCVALNWNLVGVSLSFTGYVFLQTSFGAMICPKSAYSGTAILLLLCSVLYTHWGQCLIQV